jgi:hypothetical protein
MQLALWWAWFARGAAGFQQGLRPTALQCLSIADEVTATAHMQDNLEEMRRCVAATTTRVGRKNGKNKVELK